MSKQTNKFKKASRILSSIIRAIESCFASSNITNYKFCYIDGNYELELNAELFKNGVLSFSSKDENFEDIDILLEKLIHGFSDAVDRAIEDLETVEEGYTYNFEHYGEKLIDGQAINLTTLKMFKRVIGAIKI